MVTRLRGRASRSFATSSTRCRSSSTRRTGASASLRYAADQAPALPQLEIAAGLARLAQRVVVSLRIDPVGSRNLAGSIEPVQPVSRQRIPPTIEVTLSLPGRRVIHLH